MKILLKQPRFIKTKLEPKGKVIDRTEYPYSDEIIAKQVKSKYIEILADNTEKLTPVNLSKKEIKEITEAQIEATKEDKPETVHRYRSKKKKGE